MTPHRSSDLRLLQRDFGSFYDRHRRAVAGYVGHHVGQPDVRLDIVAETFARALERRDQYRQEAGPARAWLLGIARNIIVDSARRGQVEADGRARLGMQPIVLDDEQLGLILSEPDVDLQAALAELPADQREAVLRRVVLDESYQMMARDLRCSEQVIRKRVSRGLNSLRAQIGADE
jgi:RNA polymerase sigma-70 factor (ECF subfamily)